MNRAAVAASCATRGLSCPAGYDCVCSPCQPLRVQPFEVTVAPADAPRSASACAMLHICTTLVQNAGMLVTLVDYWFDAREQLGLPQTAAVRLLFSNTPTVEGNWTAAAASATPGTWTLQLPTPSTGLSFLEVEVNGVVLDISPLIVAVAPPTCTGAGALPTTTGVCTCPGRTVPTGAAGDCREALVTMPVVPIAVGTSIGGAAVALLLFGVVVYMRRRAQALWRIPLTDVVLPESPEVLGRGTFGMVVKGTYRGTAVALKRSLPTEPVHSALRGSSVLRFRASGGTEQSGTEQGSTPRVSGSDAAPAAARVSAGSSMGTRTASDGAMVIDGEPRVGGTGPRGGSAGPRVSAGTARSLLRSQLDAAPEDEEAASSKQQTRSGSDTVLQHTRTNSDQDSYLPAACADHFPLLDGLLRRLHQRRRAAALRRDFINEMRLLVHLRHPNILTVLGAVLQDSEPILVSELMARGSLHDLLHNETLPLDGDVVCRLLRDVVAGMLFLHSADPPILHNDLKSANVLVDASFRAKVSDFGLSGKRRHGSRGPPGTPFWMAPELLLRKAPPSTATDVYSFGILLSEVFNRAEPYFEVAQLSAQEVLACVVGRGADKAPGGEPLAPLRPLVSDSVPRAYADLMRRCWHADPDMRPAMAGIAAELRHVANEDLGTSEQVTAALQASKSSRRGERALLHAVFPPAVAAALAAGRRVEPQHFDCVTIFFSDVASFTDLSATLAPLKVMKLLERLYDAFDTITATYRLFKVRRGAWHARVLACGHARLTCALRRQVETIGDAYMVCGGLTEGQDHDHVARVAAFAMDAIAAAAQILVDVDDPSRGFIAVRAGFHCGPVVASVVGRTNPRYCLFGDTVNTASRMESNSAPGRVTASPAAAALLARQAPSAGLASRGLVPIKGKGSMELFFLERKPSFEEADDAAAPQLAADAFTQQGQMTRLSLDAERPTAPGKKLTFL
jgi:serine/threonine protein kinase